MHQSITANSTPLAYQTIHQQSPIQIVNQQQPIFIAQPQIQQSIAPVNLAASGQLYGNNNNQQVIRQTPLNQPVAFAGSIQNFQPLAKTLASSGVKVQQNPILQQSGVIPHNPHNRVLSPTQQLRSSPRLGLSQRPHSPHNHLPVHHKHIGPISHQAYPTSPGKRSVSPPFNSHGIPLRNSISPRSRVTDGYKIGQFGDNYLPRTIYNYGGSNNNNNLSPGSLKSSLAVDRFMEQNRSLNHYHQDVPTVTDMIYKKENKSPLDENFKAYKNQLRSNIYSYMQMVDNIALCLKENINCEQEIENIRRQLWSRKDFEVQKLFDKFNSDDGKFLHQLQFQEGIKDYVQVEAKRSDIELLFNRYAQAYKDKKKITFQEFRHIFKITSMPSKREGPEGEELSAVTLSLIARLFKMLMNCESSFEYTRQKLKKKLCNFTYVFDYIDRQHRGILTESDIRVYLENSNQEEEFYVVQTDIDKIMQRFDRNQDGVIDLEEFLNEFQPKSKAYYIEDEY